MLRAAFALWFGMAMAPPAPAQSTPPSMADAAVQLAGRISSLLPRHATVSLEFQNLTALAPAESSSFRAALDQELRKAGLEMAATAQPEARLRVTISENPRGLLFVAATGADGSQQVAMLPWVAPPRAEVKPRVKISMQPMWEEVEAILDIMLLDPGAQLLVLGTNRVSNYRSVGGKWMLAGTANISLAHPLPRDPRGRIEGDASVFHVYLPGTTCRGTLQPEYKLTCAPGNETWPVNPRDSSLVVRWVTDRNLLESDSAKGGFYTAAGGWFASAGGRIQDRAGEPVGSAEGFGSDVGAIENPCGSAPLVLATKAGDAGERDQIQAYEIADGQAIAGSSPLPLPGPVLALWPAETAGQATIVIRNSKTGNYEASRLALACAE